MSVYGLQHESDGIVYDGYEVKYKICRFEQEPVAGKSELYIFRCRVEKECCGRECCIPSEAGFPQWLLILILLLVFLLLLLLLLALMYYCWKLYKRRQKQMPSPLPVKKEPAYRPVHVDTSDRHDLDIQQGSPPEDYNSYTPSRTSSSRSPRLLLPQATQTNNDLFRRRVIIENSSAPVSAVHVQTDEEKFESDAMEESMLPYVEPSTYEWGEDVSMEKSVVISSPERPQEQRAQIMYRTPGYDTVASY